MNTAATRSQVAAGLAGALALIATIGSGAQVQTMPDGRGQTAQYCAPLEESSVDAHRFYCRNGRGGWEPGNPAASTARPA
jgi:hypothetical protein